MQVLLAVGVAALGISPVMAAIEAKPDAAAIPRPIAAPSQPDALPLYPGMPSGGAAEQWELWPDGQRNVRNVALPTLTPFLPDPARATGAAVVVVPGGAFQFVSMDNEGWPVARWLADHGIAAFVLKYRTNRTPEDSQRAFAAIGSVFERVGDPKTPGPREPRATQDALTALRMVRAGAARWNVDPARVGMIGFSAGAMTALNAVGSPGRPAFVGYVYGPMKAVAVAPDAPPMFVALALDDPLFGGQGFGLVEAWHHAARPVELHAYERGGHGFGMGSPVTTSTLLLTEFHAWLQSRGLLSR